MALIAPQRGGAVDVDAANDELDTRLRAEWVDVIRVCCVTLSGQHAADVNAASVTRTIREAYRALPILETMSRLFAQEYGLRSTMKLHGSSVTIYIDRPGEAGEGCTAAPETAPAERPHRVS